MRESTGGRDDFGAAHNQTAAGFLLHMHVDVAHFRQFFAAIDWRIDDGMIDKGNLFLCFLVPAAGVVLERLIEVGVGSESTQKCGFVVGAASHPAVGYASPFCDRIACAYQLFYVAWRLIEPVGVAATAGVSFCAENTFVLLVMQCVVEARQHANRVAEGGVGGDVFYPLAIDPDLAAIPQTVDVLLPSEGSSTRYGVHLSDHGSLHS